MAQAFVRLGSKVTLVEVGPRLLIRDPEQAAAIIQRKLENEGVTLYLNTKVARFPSAKVASLERAGESSSRLSTKYSLRSARTSTTAN